MPHPLAVITGANRGLGFETAKQLVDRGYRVLLTARRDEDAQDAVRRLGGQHVTGEALDVTDPASVRAFADRRAQAHDVIAALVNNAGITMDGFDVDVARTTVEVNYRGAVRVTEALLPLLAPDARVVLVSSGMGELSSVSRALQRQFLDPDLDRPTLDALVNRFVAAVDDGTFAAQGWPASAYRVSKVAMNAYARLLARDLGDTARKVNAICPGWVRTRMGGRSAPRSVEEGASGITWAATLPKDGPTGGFFRDTRAIPW